MELVSINFIILTLRNKLNAGGWVGETKLASYNSIIRYEVAQSEISDKNRCLKERLINPVCAQVYEYGPHHLEPYCNTEECHKTWTCHNTRHPREHLCHCK